MTDTQTVVEIGDELKSTYPSPISYGEVGYFIGYTPHGNCKVLVYSYAGEFGTCFWDKKYCEKTGRHSDAAVQLITDMGERWREKE